MKIHSSIHSILAITSFVGVACGGSAPAHGNGAATSGQAHRTFVLVHGAFEDRTTWDRIVPGLEASGDEVLAPDLPAHGADTTPATQATLQAYTDAIVAQVDRARYPVVLVGHSIGGVVASQAAEARPEKVTEIVYLAGFILPDAQSVLGELGARPDKGSTFGKYLDNTADGNFSLKPGWVEGLFCPDCSPTDHDKLSAQNFVEPSAPFKTPIHVTQERWGSVPRSYVETKRDLAITPAKQEEMQSAEQVKKVIAIDSGHLPMLTQPNELVKALRSL